MPKPVADFLFYRVTFPAPKDGQDVGFDAMRDRLLPVILGRDIDFVPTTVTVHTSDIKRRAADTPEIWKDFMTSTAYEFFKAIDGPSRTSAVAAAPPTIGELADMPLSNPVSRAQARRVLQEARSLTSGVNGALPAM